jgi:hypothetical protein
MGLLRPIGGRRPSRAWRPGDRVTLTVRGTVAHDRAGFVTVDWDERTIEWGTDLAPEETARA